ncbi:MAG: UDP-N-acetylmuramate dehydrogenase [Holosporales bacterium]|jgi:UDP-N-acetylmuramate dehydrogenase|nr:UDP-N-acetylmuramate dehydrogenase [Holosporales bacterium]
MSTNQLLGEILPQIRGEYKFDFPLKRLSFIGTGGLCDLLFYPKDEEDLIYFLQNKPSNLPIICLGNFSNTLILDNGIRGCVINLSKFMTRTEPCEGYIRVDAGASLNSVIKLCIEYGISCCEKLFLIPGTIGGAIAMNAGIPEFEISDGLIDINCVNHEGKKFILNRSKIDMQYRKGNIPKNLIITSATLAIQREDKLILTSTIDNLSKKRMTSQPIGQQTLGSTFKNPAGLKAWKLIRKAGCENLKIGQASVSELHSNFLINSGDANSSDFLDLIRLIKDRVLISSGILLEEEINIIGE